MTKLLQVLNVSEPAPKPQEFFASSSAAIGSQNPSTKPLFLNSSSVEKPSVPEVPERVQIPIKNTPQFQIPHAPVQRKTNSNLPRQFRNFKRTNFPASTFQSLTSRYLKNQRRVLYLNVLVNLLQPNPRKRDLLNPIRLREQFSL